MTYSDKENIAYAARWHSDIPWAIANRELMSLHKMAVHPNLMLLGRRDVIKALTKVNDTKGTTSKLFLVPETYRETYRKVINRLQSEP